jgi:hypothetical protein
MSRQTPHRNSSIFNPQIIAATITALATVTVAVITVIPSVLNNITRETPTATSAVIFVTATSPDTSPVPTTDFNSTTIPTLFIPTATFDIFPTVIPVITQSPIPIATVAQPISLTLMYDDATFTVLNQSLSTVSLEGVSFRSSIGQWDAAGWGTNIYNSLPSSMCLRLRDFSAGERQPPPSCSQIYGLIETQGSSLFWLNVDQFEVVVNGTPLTTCFTAAGTCPVSIP